MTFDEAIAVLQAAKEGKWIQYRHIDGDSNWVSIRLTEFAGPEEFNFECYDYRVKPEPLEIYVNVYGSEIGACSKSERDCRKYLIGSGRIVKFREVIDE